MKANSAAQAHSVVGQVSETRDQGSGRRIKAAKVIEPGEEIARSMIDALTHILQDERHCA